MNSSYLSEGNDSKLATIVVPAYNVEQYIGDCLNSLRGQTYPNIEILVINDGSTDATASIVEEASAFDNRLHLINTDNYGVSHARNCGIDQGAGEFLLFVDADDVVASDFVETLVTPLIDGLCECSSVSYHTFTNYSMKFTDGDECVFKDVGVVEAVFGQSKGLICNKAFLFEIVRNHQIRFNENISQSEDMLFLADYLCYCYTLIHNSGIKYCYRKRSGSATMSLGNTRWFDVLEVYKAYSSNVAINNELAHKVRKSFLPVAYEGMYRYNYNKLNNQVLYSSLEDMIAQCERCLSRCNLLFQMKMFIFKHFTSLVLRRRMRGAE